MTILATGVVLVLSAIDTARNARQTFTGMIVLGTLAVALDVIRNRMRERPQFSGPEPA